MNGSKETPVQFYVPDDLHTKYKTLCNELKVTIKSQLTSFMEKSVAKYDGGPKLDPYFDPNFIPVPKLDAEFDVSFKWLKSQKHERIHELSSLFYRLHIISKALEDSASPITFNLSYEAAWRRYR